LDLHKLKCFITAAELCSITKAAEQLYITQPTLSKYISSLESELGTKLLVRQNRHIKLTPQGRFLLKEGKELLENISGIESRLISMEKGEAGELVLVSENLQNENLISLIRSFYSDFPGIEFRAYRESFDTAINALENDTADLGIVRSTLIDRQLLGKHYYMRRLFTDHLNIMVSLDNPLSEKAVLTVDDIRGVRLYYLKSPFFETADFIPPEIKNSDMEFIEIRTQNVQDATFQVLCNRGVCFADSLLRQRHADECRFLEIEGISMSLNAILLWKKTNLNPAISTFLQQAEAFFGGIESC
jgi:DNA-binding transcriptional LysR family regulator